MLTFSRVSKSFGGRVVLSDVTLTVQARSRTAAVGVNGSGKSTLLRLAAGLIAPDTGSVGTPPGTTVAYVPQDYGFVVRHTVEAFLKERTGVLALERRLRSLERAMAGGDGAAAEDYVAASDAYAALGGYEVDGRIERALGALGLPPSLLRRPLGELSGGQQVRVGLAGVLASRFSLYLLDEPTNNLDLEALALLEEFVATTDATFLLVSHDRAFLDATATDVVELSEHDHTAAAYGVTYAEYRGLRQQVRAAQSARYAAYAVEVARLQAAVRTQRARATKTRDSRPLRDNDKSARNFFAETASRQAGKATRALEQRLARLDEVSEPRSGWELRLDLSRTSRSGDLVAALGDATKTYGDFTLGPLSLSLYWRDRVALQGHNGAGKSVLLSLLTGAVAPDSGSVRLGHGVIVGVLRQSGTDLARGGSGLAVFQRHVPGPESEARTLLAKFDLGADHVLRPVATYSPGERCRLGLAILMAQGANCLVLDEPTNHLDLDAQEELEQALIAFDGTLLVVSHDREFCERVGLSRRWELADGRLLADSPA
ncbi:MAG: ABC-F family ATP-binding cassette domain-containing protein [Euzebyales bacterium]|nr:ABC-F family ATP-binding cassette domain-containing protein [Euzebyales bacterium]MBA3622235.1 ABC-F family ATP-binding cassette domain-containing protein [Euzebyales bacterium]